MEMSRIEHLFMQILDRKQWIEGQLKHQIVSYEESLAYNVLADGKQPPPWLWTSGLDGCGYPDSKGLTTEQLYSEMLFPLPQTSTPSATNSTYCTLPAFTTNKVCQSKKFMETCASNKYFTTESSYVAVPSASKLNPGMMVESEVVEPFAEFDPSARIQHPKYRQKDQDILRGEQEKSFNHLRGMITGEEHAGRLIQSREIPVKADNGRKSSAVSDYHHNIDGGRVTRSRSRSAAQTGSHQSFDKLSEPLKPSNCGENGVYQEDEIQTATRSLPSVNLNHLSCTPTSDDRGSHPCITRTAAIELGLDTASHVNSGLKMSSSTEPPLPETFPMVERKKLLVDALEDCRVNKICYISSKKKNQLSLKNDFAQQGLVQPANKDFFDRDLEKVDGSEKDVSKHGMDVNVRISNYGAEQDGLQLFESQASESHSVHTVGHQSYRQDVIGKSSTGSLAGGQHNKKLCLRSSPNSIENHGPYLPNVSEENSLLPESNKSEVSACPEDATEKIVNCCWITPNSTETQGEPTQARYYLRSGSNNDMNIVSSRSSKSNPSSCLKQAKGTIAQACGWITPNCTESQGEPMQARYCLRSRSNHDMNVASSRSSKSNSSSCLKQTEATVPQACEISSPKSRKVDYRSSNIFTTSPRFNCSQPVKDSSDCSSGIETESRLELHPISISAEIETGIRDAELEAPSKSLHRNKISGTFEGCSYLKENSNGTNISEATTSNCQKHYNLVNCQDPLHIQEGLLCDQANTKSGSCLKDETKMSEETTSKRQKHYNKDNCQNSLHETSKSPPNSEEFTKDRGLCDTETSLHMHDEASSPHYDVGQNYFDEAMPEFEGFSIDFPSLVGDDLISSESNLPSLVRERASIIEQLYKSSNVLTPVSCTSSKYKIHKVPDMYQSLPAGLLEHINLSSFLHLNDADMRQFRESDEGNLAQSDGSFVKRTYSYSMPSSTGVDRESWEPPLTPQVVKFGQKVVSERSGASPEKVCSNPELICFRIDENSSIENGNNVELAVSEEDIFLRKDDELTNRKALADITAKCENEPCFMSESIKLIDRDSLESVNSESYFRSEMSALSSVPKGYAGNKSKIGEKENSDFTVNKKLRKAALSLRNRSSRTQMSGKTNERSRSHGNLEKGCRPANMVSNISSFVPLVCQKRQAPLPLKGRKDIKVKALEAAEAAKRLEVKKKNEREMRKAAVKLEREKAEQENIRRLEVMQKQKEEERKKKEADITARKRLREEEGRKEKERKRRCIEETRRQKREQKRRPHAEKVEQKFQHKTSSGDENEQRKKEQVGEAKGKLNSETEHDFQHQTETELQPNSIKALRDEDRKGSTNIEASKFCPKSNDVQKMVIKSDDSQVLQTRISINEETQNLQSYEMSPYKDSDDDDDGEETRREKKFIPFWARRDCLHQIIHSKQHLDPAKVFCRKRSFGLNEVLPTCIRQRPV